ncbi:uncharacterized protein BDZ99DRAFT_165937 [Mytilinidion resinicola]|uniref:Uncharacterized protein n=1 Tax=Mytilinidion resinicola TaxID=574789 RepID=A0A6A6Y405_9PEZI|nr:uncharacterized protein BDZ99DRAFT_165937 [Mytilinidion resinicola]KAF2803512.1 hypothetical protein BDZ99DRAFT_165937 [Mytilinidion resinicola]
MTGQQHTLGPGRFRSSKSSHQAAVQPILEQRGREREARKVDSRPRETQSTAGKAQFDDFLAPGQLLRADQDKKPKRIGANWDILRGAQKAVKAMKGSSGNRKSPSKK